MKLINGDCLQVMKELDDNSVDAIVTDPPYGLGFMGKKWDELPPGKEVFIECLRVLKPGGYLLSFGGTRTYHRMAVAIEDAGFEIRDMIEWVYGSGFPKSHNIGKAVDKLQGNERKELGIDENFLKRNPHKLKYAQSINTGFNDGLEAAKRTKGTSKWEGWGTALKPAHEPICMAMKPREGTFAENCLKYGVGGINIDESRVKHNEPIKKMKAQKGGNKVYGQSGRYKDTTELKPNGRFPANLIHDNSEEVRECFPETGKSSGGRIGNKGSDLNMMGTDYQKGDPGFGDTGTAARYFKSIKYCPKASKSERNMGCEELENHNPCYESHRPNYKNTKGIETPYAGTGRTGGNLKNNHPTVKPIALMEYLIKMVTREGQTVLDPFMGSGTTGMACKRLGRDFIGIELNEEYIKIAEARIKTIQEKLL